MPDDDPKLLAARLEREVLDPLRRAFIDKDEVIDLFGVALVSAESLFLLGPPGTAKSALVHALGERLEARVFEYLLTRFTEPSELFGPFDIRGLREGELRTNTAGMLPEADLVFLDELLNANSAILNSLLTALNERVFRRGPERRPLPALLFIGASNRLPEDDALSALFDRFLLRARSGSVAEERLEDVLEAGWRLEEAAGRSDRAPGLDPGAIRALQRAALAVDLGPVRAPLADLVRRLRRAGIALSDRRAVRIQRPIAASALLAGRGVARPSDLWVLRHIWSAEEEVEVVLGVVDRALADEGGPERAPHDHPRARRRERVDPEAVARDLDRLRRALDEDPPSGDLARVRDRLGALAERCHWVEERAPREALLAEVDAILSRAAGRSP